MQHLDARPKDVLTAHGYTFASVNRIEDISSHRNVGTMNNCAYILKHFFNPTFGCQGFYANTYSHLRDENYILEPRLNQPNVTIHNAWPPIDP